MSRDDLLYSKIDEIFNQWNTTESPGCSLSIIRNREIQYKKGFGLRNLENKKPITSNTVFEIASVTKQFTAACIALLHLRGEISLNDSVKAIIPSVCFEQEVMIKHLIHHESGIKDYQHSLFMLNYSIEEIESLSKEELLDIMNKIPELNFTPGSQHNYSNTNYFLLGLIIEKITGKSIGEFAEQELFSPLGMKNTSFEESFPETNENIAIGYSLRENKYKKNVPRAKILGPRGIYTTVDDLFLWDQNFYTKKIGGKEFIDLMEKPSQEKIIGLSTKRWNNPAQNQGYAFGLLTDFYRGERIIRHGGDFVGYTSEILRFPDKELTIIILTNNGSINPTPLAFKVADIVLNDEFKERSPYTLELLKEVEKKEMDALVGIYYKPEFNAYASIYTEDNKLLFENDWIKSELKTVASELCTLVNQTNLIHVRKIKEAIILENEFFTAEIPKHLSVKIGPEKLAEYVGNYYNEKFKQKLLITTDEMKLKTKLEFGELIFSPINQDVFRNGFLQLEFHRKDTKISYVSLNSSGAKGIIYKKIDA